MKKKKEYEDSHHRELRLKRIRQTKINLTFSLAIATILCLAVYFLTKDKIQSLVALAISFTLLFIYLKIKVKLKRDARIKKMEEIFPDFIELMSSNLRAGMTVDQALLLSSRKEFSPLDKEILKLGKDIVTGREIEFALIELAKRTHSEKIRKTINVINSGIRSGGNLAVLLEQTATTMRQRGFVEKKAASNVLMYMIFILFAVGIGAPVLFSLSTVLVQVLTSLIGTIPPIEANIGLPFTLTSINISETFVTYFSILFIIVIDFMAALLLGLVNTGKEKGGVKYVLPLIAISLTIFFIVKIILGRYFVGIVG